MILLICFNCGVKLNNNNDRECRFCGVRFSGKCTACGFPNPQAARYCFNCGNKLAKSDSQSSVENFGTLAESRKNVAVIFADVSGFTALSEKMDPEEVREIINECFNYITSPVYELEGSIDKYIGDCVMILFGARYSHTDDANRAVMCAIKMMDLIGDFSRSSLSSKGVALSLSIGINYGLVVTGGVGNYFDRDYTVMGDIVNTAQRLQTNAGEGAILVSESVYAQTKDKFVYSDAMEVKAKNKEKPVKCYILLRINTEYIYEEELAFVERQKEIGLLNSAYNDSMNSGLKCVAVIGEAGMGKTRLIREFTSRLGNDVKKVWVECSSLSRNRSYSLIGGILAAIININPMDSNNMKQHRLISFLDYILDSSSDEEIKRNYDFLGLPMGLDKDSEFQNIFKLMDYENVKREILRQLALFFTGLCKKQRLIAVIDDVQWADSSSLKLFDELILLLADINAVFVFSSRYDVNFLPGVDDKTLKTLKLNPLTKAGIKSLSCTLLKCGRIDDRLFQAIIRFTKGNPLYVKELVSNIKRKGTYIIRKGTASINENEMKLLPENMQNLIISNISELDEASIKILQAASSIGKEFSFSLLSHLLDNGVSEDAVTGIPVQSNIIGLKYIHTSSRVLDKVFEFTHEIEREVIYGSILNRDKAALHKKIGEYIEIKFSGEIDNYSELLGEHFYKAGLYKKAADYYYKTALNYKNIFNFSISLEFFERFLELAGNEADTVENRVSNAYREMGHIHYITANYETALEYLNKALENAKLMDDIHSIKMLIAEVYKDKGSFDAAAAILDEIEPRLRDDNPIYGGWLQMKCNILRIQGDPKALSLAKKSEKILLKARDYRNLSETMKHAGMIYFVKGDIDNALSFMNKSYKYAEKNNHLEIMAMVSGDLGIIYHSTGMISKALEYFNKSMEISRKLSYQKGVTAACINLGVLYMDKGSFVAARKLFSESLSICREVNSKLYECINLTNLGDIAYELGYFELSNDYYELSLKLAMEINAPVEEGVNRIGLARVYLKTGRESGTNAVLDAACKIFIDTDEVMYLADYYTYKGLLEQNTGNKDLALEYYDKAITISEECRNDNKKLKASRYKGNLFIQTDRCEEASSLFSEAAAAAEKLDSDYEAAKCWFGCYNALNAQGKYEEALSGLERAAACIGRVDRCRWTDIIQGTRKK